VNGSAQPTEESILIISQQHLKAVGGIHLAKESSRTNHASGESLFDA